MDNNVSLALQFAPSTLQNIFGSGDIFGGGSGLDPLGIGDWMDATAQESGSSDVVILYDEAAQALVRLIQGASSLEITEAGLVMNFNNGDQAAFGFDGHLTWEPGASNAYACNNCSMEPDNTSTKILKGGVELAGATVVVGLGPEDPFADAGAGVILVGAAATAGAVYLYQHPLDISIDGLIASWMFSSHTPPVGGLIKLRNGQGWRDPDGYIWKRDLLHKDHWDVTDPQTGKKVKEVDDSGRQIWPNGPKNKNK